MSFLSSTSLMRHVTILSAAGAAGRASSLPVLLAASSHALELDSPADGAAVLEAPAGAANWALAEPAAKTTAAERAVTCRMNDVELKSDMELPRRSNFSLYLRYALRSF